VRSLDLGVRVCVCGVCVCVCVLCVCVCVGLVLDGDGQVGQVEWSGVGLKVQVLCVPVCVWVYVWVGGCVSVGGCKFFLFFLICFLQVYGPTKQVTRLN
jgi:hypothetical protein